MNKNLLFEYFTFKSLLYINRDGSMLTNDLSILKSIKLLFFFSTVGDDDHLSLIDTFGTVKAMPLGHVITDVYTSIKNDNLDYFKFNKNGVVLKVDSIHESDFPVALREAVDYRFNLLLNLNPNILEMTAYQLVELSHKWFSWNYYYKIARIAGQSSIDIPIDVIKNEKKFYRF